MSAPRIKVSRSVFGGFFFWRCKTPGVVKCTRSVLNMSGWADTIAAAADAGRAHLAAHHTAQMPPVAHGDAEPAYGAPGPHTARPGHDWDFPCCNPIQRTYDESRSDS